MLADKSNNSFEIKQIIYCIFILSIAQPFSIFSQSVWVQVQKKKRVVVVGVFWGQENLAEVLYTAEKKTLKRRGN